MMRIVVLGGTGYLGYNIVKRLVSDGHDVVCVVRSTSDCSRLKLLGVRTILSSPEQIALSFKQENFDWIINGVCTYKPNETLYGNMLESNVIFPLSVLNLAIKYHIRNFMTMGTSLPDEFNVYSFTKAKFSDFGRFLSDKDHINFVDLKLEMFYGGDGEPASRFIKNCISKLLNDRTLQLTEGRQKRDIVCVEDVLNIIEKLIEDQTGYVHGYLTCPIGSGEQHSIREIVQFLHDQTNSVSLLDFGAVPIRQGEPETIADISWYKEISYSLKYHFFEGLKEYVDEIKQN